MSIASGALAMGRRFSDSLMTDSCTIFSRTQSEDPDPNTGKHYSSDVTVYEGPCEFVAANTAPREAGSAGRPLVEQSATLRIPVSAPGSADVLPGHLATVRLTSHDPAAAPFVVRVTAGHQQTLAVARRLPVEVVSRG